MEAHINRIINQQGWTVDQLFKHQTWPTEQHGHSTGDVHWQWDSVAGLKESESFFKLWREGRTPRPGRSRRATPASARPAFFVLLTPENGWHSHADTFFDGLRTGGPKVAEMVALGGMLAVEQAESNGDKSEKVIEQVWGTTDGSAIPRSALLEDSIRKNGKVFKFLYCWTTMKRKFREVTRRIRAATQRFDIDAVMEKKFAALLITETRGWDGLSPWQRVELAVMASEVLNEHGVTTVVDQTPTIIPNHHNVPLYVAHSLGHQHIPSLTARQAQRSAVSQGALRARWT